MNRADRRAFFASAETMAKKVAAEADWPARWDAYCGCMQGSVDFAAGADFAPQDVMKLFGGDLARRVIEKCGGVRTEDAMAQSGIDVEMARARTDARADNRPTRHLRQREAAYPFWQVFPVPTTQPALTTTLSLIRPES